MNRFKDKKITLGVSSGIAIYKAVDLASRLRKTNAQLNIVMTEDAKKMISPVVFSAVGNCPVYSDYFNEVKDGWIPHTQLSMESDVFVVAPATSNIIAKIANGISDDLVSLIGLAFRKKAKIVVPTMNTRMYDSPAFQRNLKNLKNDGWTIVEPEVGHLACGEIGKGRYPDNEIIMEYIEKFLSPQDFKGKKILITAGPTVEPIDPVRNITNKSSGKMGYEIAKEFALRGAEVILISGPTNLKPSPLIKEIINITTAEEMLEAAKDKYENMNIIIMTAAVSDFKVKNASKQKIKKDKDSITLELIKNPDILKTIGKIKKENQLLVGFAAETNNLIEYAKKKLKEKNCDLIIANDVSKAETGFNVDYNEVYILNKLGDVTHVEKNTKKNIAINIADYISKLINS
ncbi:phosphopantothenoylcysteine decarboxylase [Marinitoga sp. 1135]|uniref:Coenzyme A biosynthesis bifunctional protein CoaBC n=1 Tax=Marinitoga piezophila (strain DSM 14283 / JCM 11233 / KA3) TaxID=443254 RepID=H2J3X9_MARPK|nr:MULTISPECIES: bifunctional phosphopantothenoylcysteine decarboxylase/phosphopantothenate--cysteine ligase CoaBC [Marinitoga]AEX84707.1 phosphopantothenoylcysteine decarboxylase/phosphopantothenate--cysteine ligase [Marinitoga piezophila KA3]NUU95012.1 phosphopantothenoylcysteine decarboxylase [Marinitoga sp. 1135]NUU96968.1 phosphopantothenoylcysteine decarboxylase [Marinitoga sp. 1138]